jgi:hypothetical protein
MKNVAAVQASAFIAFVNCRQQGKFIGRKNVVMEEGKA